MFWHGGCGSAIAVLRRIRTVYQLLAGLLPTCSAGRFPKLILYHLVSESLRNLVRGLNMHDYAADV